jgi:hypothetical protein
MGIEHALSYSIEIYDDDYITSGKFSEVNESK